MPKDKIKITKKLEKNGLKLMEFENILSDVMKDLKTEYFKNDILRTLQITKFLLISNPKKLVELLPKPTS